MKDYASAIKYFGDYTLSQKEDKIRLMDAYLRLGDCNFMAAKYWPAMDAYNKVIDMKSVDADYAAFQKGISYGFVNKPERKMEELEKFSRTYTKSQYIDDALYELGNTYVNQTLNEKALLTYDDLIANHTSSSYVAKAILKHPQLEADDCIAISVKYLVNKYPLCKIYIITSDRDYLQLNADNVNIFTLTYKNLADGKTATGNAEYDFKIKTMQE